MSSTIDERVVEMRFDNRQFESNVQTSLSTLDKLKQGLNLDGAAKGLEGLGDAAKKCDLSTLSRSVETVKTKFSALEVMAMTALSNITNSAVNAGESALHLLTPTRPRCPHMGCALKYNPQEHSWDCPCHGSRFETDGRLIEGPAAGGLRKKRE